MNLNIHEEHISQLNPMGTAYVQKYPTISKFFHYSPYEANSFFKKAAEIDEREIDRKKIAEAIRSFHEKWEMSAEVARNLERLEEDNSLVVIGGQQASVFLGPFFTIHKIITILLSAKEQEEALQRPVIPIFWIAGEDHDFFEINHMYIPQQKGVKLDKLSVQESVERQGNSISYIPLPKEELLQCKEQLFEKLPRTQFSAELSSLLEEVIASSETYIDLFSSLLLHFFSKYGLLLVDSGDRSFRAIQGEVFKQIINNYEAIDRSVRGQIEVVERAGFPAQVKLGDSPALLFIQEGHYGKRLLLEKVGELFRTKDGSRQFTQEQLLMIAEEEPWRLSNNVLTRPFMQERLFPTLAFVAGHGEIAYWALLSTYFELFEMKLPILLPRLSITLVESHAAKTMQKHHLSFAMVMDDFSAFKDRWLREQDQLMLDGHFAEVKDHIYTLYQPLLEKVAQINPGMQELGQKNITKIIDQVEYLERRSFADLRIKHESAMNRFDKLEQAIFPEANLQERIHNPFTFLNKHGMLLIDVIMRQPLKVNGKHKFIYI